MSEEARGPWVAGAREAAQAFFIICPPPDAQWYVEEALVPVLADLIAAYGRAQYEAGQRAERGRLLGEIDVDLTLAAERERKPDGVDALIKFRDEDIAALRAQPAGEGPE